MSIDNPNPGPPAAESDPTGERARAAAGDEIADPADNPAAADEVKDDVLDAYNSAG